MTNNELLKRRCVPCEGGLRPLGSDEVQSWLPGVPGWEVVDDGRRLRRRWAARNFDAAIAFFDRVADLARREDHHPDLHLESYRHVTIELWTHSMGGLSENDFILAAKISALPIATKRG